MREQISRTLHEILDSKGASSPTALKGAILDLARAGQIGISDPSLFRRVCGPMRAEAEAAFGPLTLILALTEEGRRQVYFAALAGLAGAGRLEEGAMTPAWREELISAMLTMRNEELIRWSFGSCPSGFLRVLSRLRGMARSPDLYRRLHALLTEDLDLGNALPDLLKNVNLDKDLMDLFRVLPSTAEGRQMAVLFRKTDALDRFMSIYRSLTGREDLTMKDRRLLFRTGNHERFLRNLYRGTRFPDPVISHPELTHLADLSDLKRIACEFENCLANYLDEAIRGDHQYYVWRPDGEPPVVFQIKPDGPFGWYLGDHRLKENEPVPEDLKTRLKGVLSGLGITRDEPIESLMCFFDLLSDEDEEASDPEDPSGEEGPPERGGRLTDAEISEIFGDGFVGFGRRAA
jgi:hypothetical protein